MGIAGKGGIADDQGADKRGVERGKHDSDLPAQRVTKKHCGFANDPVEKGGDVRNVVGQKILTGHMARTTMTAQVGG